MNEIIFHIYQPSNITKNSIKLDSKLNNITLKDYFINNIVHIFDNYNKEDKQKNNIKNIEEKNIEKENIEKENIEEENIEEDNIEENIEKENIEEENIKKDNDIYKNYYFLDNFKILPYDTLLKSITNEIIIMNKNHFQKKNDSNPIIDKNNSTNEIPDQKILKYISLLNKYPELLSFIYLLDDKIEFESILMFFYKLNNNKRILNIIKNNQSELIEMVQYNSNILDTYLKSFNSVISSSSYSTSPSYFSSNFTNLLTSFTSIINQNTTSLVIADIENIFPDVPQENIEELINVFYNQPLII
jgi:hypothetical protein